MTWILLIMTALLFAEVMRQRWRYQNLRHLSSDYIALLHEKIDRLVGDDDRWHSKNLGKNRNRSGGDE